MTSEDKKEYYRKVISEQKDLLARTRNLLTKLVHKLEEEVEQHENGTESNLDRKFWWGEKESITSVIVKLSGVILRIVPLELEVVRADMSKLELEEMEQVAEYAKAPPEDIEMINNYVQRWNQMNAGAQAEGQ